MPNFDPYADLVSTVIRVEGRLRRQLERSASWYWNAWHLPSMTDIRRISSQLGAMEARVRDLSDRLGEVENEEHRGSERRTMVD